jgi:hypothetical protein
MMDRRVGFVLLAVGAALLAWMVLFAAKAPPSFDGAMNLQVAQSLANGEGYRRSYADRIAFPQEVQTNAPYVVPAAVVYKIFGVGIAQSQVVNQAYLVLFALGVAWLLRRQTGVLGAGLGMAFALATPGVLRFGMGGYGEVVALAWAMLALVAFPWEDARRNLSRCVLAGLCLALALCTKTVMAICVVAFGLTMAVVAMSAPGVPLRDRRNQLLGLGAATALPMLVFEIWRRASSAGQHAATALDWQARLHAIYTQAGVAGGFQDTANLGEKFTKHFALLSGFFGVSGGATWVWLLGAAVLSVVLVATRRIDPRRHAPLFALLAAAGVYFAWWLLITPTGKAWHRRILDGALLLNVAWAYVAALSIQLAAQDGSRRWRGLAWVPAVMCMLFGVRFARTDALPIMEAPPDTRDLQRTVDLVRALPPDAQLFGIGWYSAPTVSLLAGRPMQDFNDAIVRELDPRRPVYFVFDAQALAAHRQDEVMRLYPLTPLLPEGSGSQVYRADLAQFVAMPGPSASKPATPRVDLIKDDYPYLHGFYGAESSGTRWMRTDAEVLLKYDGSPAVATTVYVVSPPAYHHQEGGVALHVSLDGCDAGEQRVAKSGLYPLTFVIPAQCRPAEGKDVRVRIMADNIVESSITRDDRGLALSMRDIGFATPPAASTP